MPACTYDMLSEGASVLPLPVCMLGHGTSGGVMRAALEVIFDAVAVHSLLSSRAVDHLSVCQWTASTMPPPHVQPTGFIHVYHPSVSFSLLTF